MEENNGAVAPNEPALSDAAIDAVIDDGDQPVIGDETHKLASKLSELEQQLRAKDEVIQRRDRDYQSLVETSRRQSEMLSELVGDFREAKDRGYEYERERLEAIQRKAVTEADTAVYDDAARAIRALDAQKATVSKAKPADHKGQNPADQNQQAPDPVAAAWLAENPWFTADADLMDYALSRERRLMTKFPGTAERLAEVKKEVVKAFPDKFPNHARQQPQTVSRPGPQAAKPKPKEPTLADLDDDAKAALAAIKRVDPKFKDETYIKGFKQREARQKEISRL